MLALDVGFQDGHALKLQSEALSEEALDAFDVTSEVILCVQVRRGDHLREIDHGDFLVLTDHEIELVEVAMDEAVLRELNDELDQAMVDLLSVDESFDVDHRVGLDQGHHDTVSVRIDRHRSWEASLIQRLHERILFQRGYPRHVEPARGSPSFQVVTVSLDRSERGTAKPLELDNDRFSLVDQLVVLILLIAALADVDITFLSDADLRDNFFDMASLHEDSQGQVVVAHVCERVAAVVLACVEHALMLEQVIHNFEGARALQVGKRFDQGHRNELVVSHTLLDGREDAEVIIGEILD